MVAELIDQIGRGRHALQAGQARERAHAGLAQRRKQPGVADLAQHEEHRGRLLQLAGGFALAGTCGELDDALDLVVARDLGQP